MEIRRVQLTGGSSYVVTLPKEWISKMNVKKNDPLGIIVQQDGTLLVTARISEEHRHREKTLDADEAGGKDEMTRLLIGAYITGYTTIVVKSKRRLDPGAREAVMRFTRTAIGPEVIDESAESITLKDLLNPAQMPFDKTLRRMFVLAKTMQEDSLQALETADPELAASVIERDRELDRLHWLVSRQLNMVLSDPSLSRRMGATQEDALYAFLLSRILERIGDHAVRMATNAKELISAKPGTKTARGICGIGRESLALYVKSIESWFRRDLRSANRNIEESRKIVKECEGATHGALDIRGAGAVSAGNMMESIRRIASLSADVNELLINNIVRDEKEN